MHSPDAPTPNNPDLIGKVVVITGASAGIGAALAREVHRRGGVPVLAARRAAELAEVAESCGHALAVATDVCVRAEVEALARAAVTRHGRIDAWVNNAGQGISRLPSQLEDADFDEMMSVNVKSAWHGVQAALPVFRGQGHGHIVNVSSMLGRLPLAPIRSAYIGAKHFMNGLTAALRMELAGTASGSPTPGKTAWTTCRCPPRRWRISRRFASR